MGHKSNGVGEDEEGDKSIPLLPLRVQIEYNVKRRPTKASRQKKNRAFYCADCMGSSHIIKMEI